MCAVLRMLMIGTIVTTALAGLWPRTASEADDLSPCRAIVDRVNPRFSAVWVADEEVWVADDLQHALIVLDRESGAVKRIIRGLSTQIDFPSAIAVDPTFKVADGKRGAVWVSMNDTSDRALVFSKDDGDPTDPSKMNVPPLYLIDFRQMTLEGMRIYNQDRVYGFAIDPRNDEVALTLEKGDWIDPDGCRSLGSLVVLDRGGADRCQLGASKRWIRGPHTGLANPHGLFIDARRQVNEIFVTNYGHIPQEATRLPSITVYDRRASGDVPPKRTIQGDHTHMGMPVKVFVDDEQDELVVADDQNGILVFDRSADGNVMPKRMIHSHAMPNGVFVDAAHDELVVANWNERTIQFFERTWDADDMHPMPKRTIAINPRVPVIGIGNPGAIAYARDEIAVTNCVSHPGISFYERSADGAVRPKRHLEGHDTHMSRSIHGLALWQHPTDPELDELFVPKPLGSAILVFNRTDDGNVAPQRVIQGPATLLDGVDALAVDDDIIAVPNRDGSILIFPRLGNGNIRPLRRITYRAGERDTATGRWLGPWGEGSRIGLGPGIWIDNQGTAEATDDEIVVRARYQVSDPMTGETRAQGAIVFFPKDARGATIPKRIIASRALTGVHQVAVLGNEVLCAVQGERAIDPPTLGGLAVFDRKQTSTLDADGRTLRDIAPLRLLRGGTLTGGRSGVRHPRAVAADPVRWEVYLGDSKGNDVRVFRVDWQEETCLPE